MLNQAFFVIAGLIGVFIMAIYFTGIYWLIGYVWPVLKQVPSWHLIILVPVSVVILLLWPLVYLISKNWNRIAHT